ncbi:MAG TPA: 2OG-Fe(II) oxygenase [Saprospiraceae bacterium]|nr:2OG-Fe(II) oxygenase [Saprospiraceae bacterium]
MNKKHFEQVQNEEMYEEIIVQLLDNGFAIQKDFIPAEILNGLLSNLLQGIENQSFKNAGTGNIVNHAIHHDIRKDNIMWLEEDTGNEPERMFHNTIWDFAGYMNSTCFTGIKYLEFHYACYEAGAFYKRHLDRFKNDDARIFSIITYLNKDWNELFGGQLILYLPDGERRINPEFGISVFLKSDQIEHEVIHSTHQRYSITGWFKTVNPKGVII